jgi:uncharacterized protein
MKIRMALPATVFISLWVFTACMNLGSSPSTRFYLLDSQPGAIESTGQGGRLADASLSIGPVTIASYLDRPQLVTRLGGNELRIDEFSQWAEPLRTTISRVIEENVARLTGTTHIHAYPKRRSAVVDYRISLDVLRFDPDAAGTVTLKSVWRIVNPAGHQRLVEGRTTIVQPSGGSHTVDVVDAMNQALAALSQEMVDALAEVAGQAPGMTAPDAAVTD